MAEFRRSISIRNAHPRLRLDKGEIKKVIGVLDANAAAFLGGCPSGELSVVFLTDSALARIHADFMNDPGTTDVITFEGNPTMDLAGEICVSADTAARYVGAHSPGNRPAASRKPAPADIRFSRELTLYVVHGWLHLAGYDDLQPAKKRRMRAAEKRAMSLLSRSAAIPGFSWR